MSRTSPLSLSVRPESICLLRLSAIGDVTHMLPVVHTLQHYWPETKLTWIIGRLEHQLVGDIEGIEFIVFDKSKGWRAYYQLLKQLYRRRFDVLLHMQVSLRANLASLCVRSPVKLGFDRKRAKNLQWVSCNSQIKPTEKQHVLDVFFEFLSAVGLSERQLYWNIPVPEKDQEWASGLLAGDLTLIINPSSSQRHNNWRNWHADKYAKIIEYAIQSCHLSVVLTGSSAENEIKLAEDILENELFKKKPELIHKVKNLVGKTSLKQLAALMKAANVVIAPDTGPAHIANAFGTPVIGLYVTSNPKRTGPYCFQEITVNEYPTALLKYEGLTEEEAPWGKRVRNADAMDLIRIDHVKDKLEKVIRN